MAENTPTKYHQSITFCVCQELILMGTWIDIANTEKQKEVLGEKKTIGEVGQMIPRGVLNWCRRGSVNTEDSSM